MNLITISPELRFFASDQGDLALRRRLEICSLCNLGRALASRAIDETEL